MYPMWFSEMSRLKIEQLSYFQRSWLQPDQSQGFNQAVAPNTYRQLMLLGKHKKTAARAAVAARHLPSWCWNPQDTS